MSVSGRFICVCANETIPNCLKQHTHTHWVTVHPISKCCCYLFYEEIVFIRFIFCGVEFVEVNVDCIAFSLYAAVP